MISSRTPEGIPHRCPVCGEVSFVEPSYPGGDACCPRCGQLLWQFRDQLSGYLGIEPNQITLETRLDDNLIDSLDVVELVMKLEETFEVSVPDEVAERLKTVEDAIRYIEEQRRQ